jgi:hypothetical protein
MPAPALPPTGTGGFGCPQEAQYRRAGVFAVTLIASAAQADGPDISAQSLLSSWHDEDPGMRMGAEVIASAFASGLSWKGTLGGKEIY